MSNRQMVALMGVVLVAGVYNVNRYGGDARAATTELPSAPAGSGTASDAAAGSAQQVPSHVPSDEQTDGADAAATAAAAAVAKQQASVEPSAAFRETTEFEIPRQHHVRTRTLTAVADLSREEFDDIAVEAFSRDAGVGGRRAAGPAPRRPLHMRCHDVYEEGVCIRSDGATVAGARGKVSKHTPFIQPRQAERPLHLFAPGRGTKVKSLLCNEGERKRVPMEGVLRRPGDMPVDDALLLVVLCWDTVGYHLFSCTLGAWAVLYEKGLLERYPDVKVAVLKSNFVPQRMGSHVSWNDTRSYLSQYKSNNQWALWGGVTSRPENVRTLREYAGRCFSKAVVGHVPLYDVTPFHTSMFVRRVLRVAGVVRPPPPLLKGPCAPPVVTVVERKANFHIKNLAEVVDVATIALRAGGARRPAVSVVVYETMPFVEQLAAATRTNVMIGTHGNGMTWVSFMPAGGTLIELWGQYPYNANYRGMATRAYQRYIPVSLHLANCQKRCDLVVAADALKPAVETALAHYRNVSCAGQWYDPDYLELAWDNHLIAVKKRKPSKQKSGGSADYVDSSNL